MHAAGRGPKTPMRRRKGSETRTVRSVERAARIWQALLRSGRRGKRVTELSQELSLHKTTVVRLLQTFVAIGVVRKDEKTDHYTCEPLIWLNLIYGLKDLIAPAHTVQTIVDELATESGETVLLGSPDLDGGTMRSVIFALSPHPIRVDLGRESAGPLHAIAAGKAYLSELSDEDLTEWTASGLTACTPRTITDPEALRKDLAQARERGYAITREEHIPATAGMGVPIRSDRDQVTAALQLATPVERMTEENVERWEPMLKRAAQQIARVLYLTHAMPAPRETPGGLGAGESANGVEGGEGETALRKRYPMV